MTESSSHIASMIEKDQNANRTLYECFNAKVKGDLIYCVKGHTLGCSGDGALSIKLLARGEPLVMSICQDCADFERMGGPIACEERGWLKEATRTEA